MKMNALRNEIQTFTQHVHVLAASSKSFDSRILVEEANRLLQRLGAARLEFKGLEGSIDSLSRALPSRPGPAATMSPAAQWVPELRAASRQFGETVRDSEKALRNLYSKGFDGLNDPLRTPNPIGPPMPARFDSVLDMVLTLSDLLTKSIELWKRKW
jgi:hypothetical protein